MCCGILQRIDIQINGNWIVYQTEKKGNEPIGVFSSDESSFLATANVLGSLPDEVLWYSIVTVLRL